MDDEIKAALEGAETIHDEPIHDDEEFAPPPEGAQVDGPDQGPRLPSGRKVDAPLLEQIRANASEPPTDIGNGRRFLTMQGQDALYVPNMGWFLFDGTRWKQCEDLDPVRIRAHRTAETIELEAQFFLPSKAQAAILEAADLAVEDITPLEKKRRAKEKLTPDQTAQLYALQATIDEGKAVRERLAKGKEARRKYARSSQNKNKITAMMEEARPYIATEIAKMDADPLALNVANGSLRFVPPAKHGDLWTVQLEPHARAQMHSKIAAAAYDEDAECPRWLTFLERIVPDEATRAFLKRWFGYTLTGLTREQVFVFFYGEGSNGKSTLVDTIAKILADYCVTVPFATLAGDDKRRGDSATPDLVRLPGARMVRAAEPEKGVKLKEAEVKALTGGEAILIRRMREEFIELEPEFKLVLSGNHEPAINGNDHGIWRRTLLVPFTQEIPKSEIDMSLGERLMDERDGILAWAVAGCLEYLEEGLNPPDEVLAATAKYRESQDPITNFVSAAFVFPPSDGVDNTQNSPKAMYDAYLRWCEAANEKPFQQKTFSTAINKLLPKLGATRPKVQGIYMQQGFTIAEAFKPQHDGEHGSYHGHTSGQGTQPTPEPDKDIPF